MLEEALAFFQLNESSSELDLKNQYQRLAKRYHPDAGEYDSAVMFLELQRHYEFLKEWWNTQQSFVWLEKKSSKAKDPIFEMYKLAKEKETIAILQYFEKNKNTPLVLEDDKNKGIESLRKALEPVREIYREITFKYPNSIWAKDSEESLQRISVWWK
ncbi:DnaJ domain protein [Leptospira ryugenii]|uniref:DnaJ domain protein n=1 Tax=Leptospira ryugenii TaxID=1917863 RepID=A0A2P2DXJ4_9LEPT|nr:DnaJ domain protein [Leptospira ryugenii]